MLHVDDTAELLVRTFRIKVGGDSLEFRYSGKKPNRSVLYNVSLGMYGGPVYELCTYLIEYFSPSYNAFVPLLSLYLFP